MSKDLNDEKLYENLGKSIPGKRNNKFKGYDMGVSLAWWNNGGADMSNQCTTRDEVRQVDKDQITQELGHYARCIGKVVSKAVT